MAMLNNQMVIFGCVFKTRDQWWCWVVKERPIVYRVHWDCEDLVETLWVDECHFDKQFLSLSSYSYCCSCLVPLRLAGETWKKHKKNCPPFISKDLRISLRSWPAHAHLRHANNVLLHLHVLSSGPGAGCCPATLHDLVGTSADVLPCGFVWKWLVPLHPMVLLIIIPIKWL